MPTHFSVNRKIKVPLLVRIHFEIANEPYTNTFSK